MKRTSLIILLLILCYSCNLHNHNNMKMDKTIKIAISKASGSENYKKYGNWLLMADSNLELIDLYHLPEDSVNKIISEVDGLMLTGGPDVHPVYFNKESDSNRCSIDLKRDTLEFNIIKKAIDRKIPILAICRGEQIFNVALGGSLIIDIPTDTDSKIIHRLDSGEPVHEISIQKNSFLYKISGLEKAVVNSYHHQAVEKLAKQLDVSARTSDGIIEAYEYKDFYNNPFMLAIQWHPERLKPEHPLSLPLAKSFIDAIKKETGIIK